MGYPGGLDRADGLAPRVLVMAAPAGWATPATGRPRPLGGADAPWSRRLSDPFPVEEMHSRQFRPYLYCERKAGEVPGRSTFFR